MEKIVSPCLPNESLDNLINLRTAITLLPVVPATTKLLSLVSEQISQAGPDPEDTMQVDPTSWYLRNGRIQELTKTLISSSGAGLERFLDCDRESFIREIYQYLCDICNRLVSLASFLNGHRLKYV